MKIKEQKINNISKTLQFHPIKIRSRNTFSEITSTNIPLHMRNEASNWQ